MTKEQEERVIEVLTRLARWPYRQDGLRSVFQEVNKLLDELTSDKEEPE